MNISGQVRRDGTAWATVCDVSILETTLIFVGIPLLVILILAGLGYIGPRYTAKDPAEYKLGNKWDHEPVLWSAVDEVAGRGHHGGHGHAGSATELIGGTASGKW